MQCSDLFFKRSLTFVVSILKEKLVQLQQQQPRLENILRAAYEWGEGVSTLVKDKFCTCFGGMCK